MIERYYDLIREVRLEFAPDPRIAVFEVDVVQEETDIVLFGAISLPAAAEALRERIAAVNGSAPFRDLLVRLPAAMEGRSPHAIVTAATAPMLASPLVSDSHLSQVLLGSRVLVLREHGRWLQCRSADGYLGWIHRGYLNRMDEIEARAWEAGAAHPLHLSLGAEVLDPRGEIVARLPWGARLHARAGVAYLPDGSEGKLRGPVVPVAELGARFPREGTAIVATARLWMGAPYLWGGTTPWGVDCSGLVQAVLRTHGIELPRDSDQQADIGTEIDFGSDLDHLLPGDLLYFAEQEDRVSHVAISTGGSAIIHSALGNGGVREDDLDGGRPYEHQLRSLLVRIRRVIDPAV